MAFDESNLANGGLEVVDARSGTSRRAIYATYNSAREGDLHRSYYERRKREWPATHMCKEGG